MRRPLAALALLALGSAPAHAMNSATPDFAVRADLTQAEAIAPVLARIGEPVLYLLPAGKDPAAVLAEACASQAPAVIGIVSEPTADGPVSYVKAAPCVRRLGNVVALARDGDTLETVAVRLGMRPSSAYMLRIERDKTVLRRQMRTALSRGDRIVAASAPDWSVIRPRPGTIRSRLELVEEIAAAMKCGAEEVNSCLLRRSVLVTERTPAKATSVLQSRAGAELQAGDGGGGGAPGNPAAITGGARASAVAPGQWPYDAELIKMLLNEAVAARATRPILIGVADNGLGDINGKPLAASLFGKTYDTAGIGAGAPRDDRSRSGMGDVSLCASAPATPFASLPPPGLEEASHGAIVSSIATGQGLRSEGTAAALPQLLFYRTVRNGCDAASNVDASENDLIDAAESLSSNDIKVLNISMSRNWESSYNLRSRLGLMLRAPYAPVLVAAAGNFTGDLDASDPPCPACLGNAERNSDVPRYRIVTVGAAESSLHRADYSGYGDKTVRLYAPGEPAGAIDIDGNSAGAFQSATSYATPLVSLAIGMAYALGMEDPAKVRNRLLLSTWPLLDDSGKPIGAQGGPLDIGVLDLLRIAALRRTSIETLQTLAGGSVVRRTYVGRITGGLDLLCPGEDIQASGNQAIRFGAADANGVRDTVIASFKPDPDTYFPKVRHVPCASSGSITIDALRDGTVTVPAENVTQILLPIPFR